MQPCDIWLRLTFGLRCGAPSSRPTCTCRDGEWKHPFYIALCADGVSEPTTCVCPNGSVYI